MVSITIKNIPSNTYERLKDLAKSNRRSINSEVIFMIEQAIQSRKVAPEKFLVEARKLREKTANTIISDDEFKQAKETGRS